MSYVVMRNWETFGPIVSEAPRQFRSLWDRLMETSGLMETSVQRERRLRNEEMMLRNEEEYENNIRLGNRVVNPASAEYDDYVRRGVIRPNQREADQIRYNAVMTQLALDREEYRRGR